MSGRYGWSLPEVTVIPKNIFPNRYLDKTLDVARDIALQCISSYLTFWPIFPLLRLTAKDCSVGKTYPVCLTYEIDGFVLSELYTNYKSAVSYLKQ